MATVAPSGRNLPAVALMALTCFVAACGGDRWLAVVYPDASNLFVYELAGEYETLETCRAAAVARLRSLGASTTGDYECGRGCERDEGLDMWTCEETSD